MSPKLSESLCVSAAAYVTNCHLIQLHSFVFNLNGNDAFIWASTDEDDDAHCWHKGFHIGQADWFKWWAEKSVWTRQLHLGLERSNNGKTRIVPSLSTSCFLLMLSNSFILYNSWARKRVVMCQGPRATHQCTVCAKCLWLS